VTAISVSSAVRPHRRAASAAHSSSDWAGAVPGLKSVAIATRAPLARSSFALGSF